MVKHLEENAGASGLTIKRADLEGLENLFVKEETLLEKKEKRIIHTIMSNPLPSNPHQAFTDLVYVLETSLNMGMLSDDSARTMFADLWPLKKMLDENSLSKLAEVQKRLRALIK